MQERMYNVIRYQKIKGDTIDSLLKNNDVLKMGRVKLKVKKIVNAERQKLMTKRFKRRKERLENRKIHKEQEEERK